MEDRYIMMVDENGQPFICHAGVFQKAGNAIKSAGTAAANAVRGVGRGRGTRQNHKYLMKVGTPEKPRYLYTQEEVRAYLQGGRRALNNAVNTAKNTAKKTGDVIKDKAGVDERQRAVTATKQYVEEWKKAGNNRTDAYDKAARNLNNAVADYQKTPLGKAETAFGKVTRPVRTVARAAKKLDDAVDIKLKDRDGNVITAKGVANNVVDKVKDKAGDAVENAKTKYDRMRDEFKEQTGINAKRELEKAERDSYEAAKAYKQTERVERENGNDGTNLEALRNLNDKNNAEDYAKYLYERTPLGKAEKLLKGESNTERHTSHEKTVEKANADMDRHDLEIAAKRGPIDLDHVSKEYMFALGSNTGHGSEVKKAMEANDAYNIARRKYDSLAKDKNAPSTSVLLAKKQMEVAKKEYDKRMGALSDVLNNDVEEAKKELSKKNK